MNHKYFGLELTDFSENKYLKNLKHKILKMK